MAFLERTYGKETNAVIDEVLISSDSHVIEPAGLWQKQLPKAFQDRPRFWRAKAQRHARWRPGQEQARRRDGRRRRQRRSALSDPWLEVLEPRRSRVGSSLRAGLQRLAHRLLQRRARTAYRYRHAVDVRHRRRREGTGALPQSRHARLGDLAGTTARATVFRIPLRQVLGSLSGPRHAG